MSTKSRLELSQIKSYGETAQNLAYDMEVFYKMFLYDTMPGTTVEMENYSDSEPSAIDGLGTYTDWEFFTKKTTHSRGTKKFKEVFYDYLDDDSELEDRRKVVIYKDDGITALLTTHYQTSYDSDFLPDGYSTHTTVQAKNTTVPPVI